MRKLIISVAVYLLISGFSLFAQQVITPVPKIIISSGDKTVNSQWQGKRVAFLGDSMTDKRNDRTTYVYWEYLKELLGIEPFVYGINGNQWNGIYNQAVKLHEEKEMSVDAILIFAGTNDYNKGIPIGEFFSEETKLINYNGNQVMRKYRTPIVTDSTFCGRINKVMSYLKNNFPQQQIIILTPIHRGFAQFNEKNVQPDENYANTQGLYINTYINVLKQAASNWAVPLIDLYSISGLFPLADAQIQYFSNKDTDKLHPNALGNYRIAKTLQYQLLALPSGFIAEQK